jgi:hypothetical protein
VPDFGNCCINPVIVRNLASVAGIRPAVPKSGQCRWYRPLSSKYHRQVPATSKNIFMEIIFFEKNIFYQKNILRQNKQSIRKYHPDAGPQP